jgi:hypothetical protein
MQSITPSLLQTHPSPLVAVSNKTTIVPTHTYLLFVKKINNVKRQPKPPLLTSKSQCSLGKKQEGHTIRGPTTTT